MACISCGKDLTANAKFCRHCGVSQSESRSEGSSDYLLTPSQLVGCSSCGAPLIPGARFCKSCGSQVLKVQPNAALEKTSQNIDPAIEEKRTIDKVAKTIQAELEHKTTGKVIKTIFIFVIVASLLGLGAYYGIKLTQGPDITRVQKPMLQENGVTTRIQELLKSLGGEYIASDNCYVSTAQTQNGPQNFCNRLIETLEIKEGSNTFIYATVAGLAINDDKTLDGSHAASGLINFLKFKIENEKLKFITGSGDIFSGSFGNPGNAKIITLGKNNSIGLIVVDGWAGMGEASSYLSIYSQVNQSNKGIKKILAIQTAYDNTGTCSDDDKTCASKEIIATVIQNKNEDVFYPLEISVSTKQGSKSNKSTSNKDFVVDFDKKTNSYKVPTAYQSIFN